MYDLTRNYLNGTIPPQWGSLQQVTHISLLGNRLTGSIPKEIGNISTLQHITLEFNQLSGTLPPELGNLSQINNIHLTSNYFTGEPPGTLAELITLRELAIQASGLDGPIPPKIASLTKMIDLRISDLNGMESTFPHLNNMKNMSRLILRSCNIIGPLPTSLGDLTELTTLDLSFNKLNGEISNNFGTSLPNLRYIISTNFAQKLEMIFHDDDRIEIQLYSCLSSLLWTRDRSSFYINCGGKETSTRRAKYEDDLDSGGPAQFVQHGSSWASSSTGRFLDENRSDSFIVKTTSRLSMRNFELYMDARLSPISLTYYGLCLLNGNYTVQLHFAEIMFTDDKTYSSLGRRIFDIYIQGKLKLKNFNIEIAAGGVNKETIQTFTTVVTNSTLEIRLYWAGQGTTGIPMRGVYGPLISAISVFNPDHVSKNENISVGAVVGIVAAVAFVIILLLVILWWRGCLLRKDTMEHDLKGLDLQTCSFTLRQLKVATNNFDVANKIGEGGFGSVYQGRLPEGTIIAVKKLSSKSKQGNREFLNEIGMISALQHPHLVKLYGCCVEGNQLLLVYEYMENNSLAHALFGLKECQLKLDWATRYRICIGIAKGLAYLHEESRFKIVHRDIKATNVLLDKNLNPKISDFGLAKLNEEDDTHISTRIAGTYGYMAPEYAMRGYLTDKADVYSFGIVALEIVSGRNNTSNRRKEDSLYLLDWALELNEKGKLMELVDPKLGPDFIEKEVIVMINIALLCTNVTPTIRPTMSSVVSMLEGRAVIEESVSDSTVFSHKMTPKGMMADLERSHETDTNDSLVEMPLTASSTSNTDPYPLNSSSDYWANRE
ncbi:unnamed protein product [Camellia sinensis]